MLYTICLLFEFSIPERLNGFY